MADLSSATRHTKSPHDTLWFMLDEDSRVQYVGEDYARGIKCTQWYAQGTETEEIGGHTITTTAKRNHWFSVPGWVSANCAASNVSQTHCATEVPIRTVSEGTVYNHTSKQTTKFHDHYEYTAFVAGPPAPQLFAPESSVHCTKGAKGSTAVAVFDRFATTSAAASAYASSPASRTAQEQKLAAAADALYADAYRAAGSMPALPEAYQAVVEVNRVKEGKSMSVLEWFDFNAQRVRTDVYGDGERASVIRDYNTRSMYTIVDPDVRDDPFAGYAADDECLKTQLQEEMRPFAGQTRHMKSPHEVFMFASDGSEQYVGLDYARGIKCTQWYAAATETQVVNGHTVTVESTRNHWFSAPGWSEAQTGGVQVPVRIVSEGTVYNHTSKQTTKFHDHYEYMSFIVGKPPTYLFDVSTVCPGAKAPADNTATETATEVPPSYGSKGSTSGG